MNKPVPLLSYQRAYLKKRAHELKPIVSIGTGGISDAVELALKDALDHHELIKVKFYDLKAERREGCDHLAQISSSVLVGVIGNIGIFFRPAASESDRRIRVPIRKNDSKTPGDS